jgi:DNA-directed RNA polymerase subunit RPC12/RpoP
MVTGPYYWVSPPEDVMADINFNCPQCGQNLDAPEDMLGLFVECPACSKIIKIPRPGENSTPTPELRPAPPRPASPQPKAPVVGPDEKGSTVQIKLPPNLGVPPTPKRQIVIKRKN